MKKISAVTLVALIASVMLTSCNKSGESPTSLALQKSGTMLMKIGIAVPNSQSGRIPVPGGYITVDSLMINLQRIQIQENSGFQGEQQGEHSDPDGGGSEGERGDIVISGPLALEISSGLAAIGPVPVYAGTFLQTDLHFAPSPLPPLNGNAIVVRGTYIRTDSTHISLTMLSRYSNVVETRIANGGIIVPRDSTVTVRLTFNLNSWFGTVPFNNAQLTNGRIIVDQSNNTQLLTVFETNLRGSAEEELEGRH